ncbi:hypothetical protein GJ496_006180 [Pomphorhynchus laevis]|nr:hypothetical protein GJ496_006180 [Pomphorhynchus laevis]
MEIELTVLFASLNSNIQLNVWILLYTLYTCSVDIYYLYNLINNVMPQRETENSSFKLNWERFSTTRLKWHSPLICVVAEIFVLSIVELLSVWVELRYFALAMIINRFCHFIILYGFVFSTLNQRWNYIQRILDLLQLHCISNFLKSFQTVVCINPSMSIISAFSILRVNSRRSTITVSVIPSVFILMTSIALVCIASFYDKSHTFKIETDQSSLPWTLTPNFIKDYSILNRYENFTSLYIHNIDEFLNEKQHVLTDNDNPVRLCTDFLFNDDEFWMMLVNSSLYAYCKVFRISNGLKNVTFALQLLHYWNASDPVNTELQIEHLKTLVNRYLKSLNSTNFGNYTQTISHPFYKQILIYAIRQQIIPIMIVSSSIVPNVYYVSFIFDYNVLGRANHKHNVSPDRNVHSMQVYIVIELWILAESVPRGK